MLPGRWMPPPVRADSQQCLFISRQEHSTSRALLIAPTELIVPLISVEGADRLFNQMGTSLAAQISLCNRPLRWSSSERRSFPVDDLLKALPSLLRVIHFSEMYLVESHLSALEHIGIRCLILILWKVIQNGFFYFFKWVLEVPGVSKPGKWSCWSLAACFSQG